MGATRLDRRRGGGSRDSSTGSWEVLLSAPLAVHNALPVPVDVSVSAWGKPHRLLLQPNQHAALHAVDAAHVEHITLRALGYHPTRPIAPATLPATAADVAAVAGAGHAAAAAHSQQDGGSRELLAPDTEIILRVGLLHTQLCHSFCAL